MTEPVVVGVDGSLSSLAATEVGAREARLRGTALRLVHAVGEPGSAARPRLRRPPSDAPRRAPDASLAAAERRARVAAPGVATVGETVAGEARAVLESESREAALTVTGTRGRNAVAGLLLGSTTLRLATRGSGPLLVVRDEGEEGEPDGTVLLAVDGSPEGRAAVEFAFDEASLRGADLVAAHVWNTRTSRVYDGPADPPFVTYDEARLRDEEERVLERALAAPARRHPDVAPRSRLLRGRVRTTLVEESAAAGLVVVGTRGRGGLAGLVLGSVGQALLRHAHCPVAIVRPTGG
ncbi:MULTISPECIES: universal stress protein [unclassified Streptomyces]|uniref:universal stress protein n=1 Tax=unclassified Streptomyces TaxID=2593676 RepID=UPI001902DCC7|nr:universal stress protein [Streptomyces sp. HSG2]